MSIAAPSVPISWGELLDKITILEIKRERLERPEARRNVETELHLLNCVADPILGTDGLDELLDELRRINEDLWEIEDAIRECEAARDFGDTFIRLARSVYVTNDERARVKREINALLGSLLVEEKGYADYAGAAPTAPLARSQPAATTALSRAGA